MPHRIPFLKIVIVILFLLKPFGGSAQLSSQDSLFFHDRFKEILYIDTTLFPGQWYVHEKVTSVSDLYQRLDSIFPFSATDFTSAYTSLQVSPSFHFDNHLNPTFNHYYDSLGTVYYQHDPLIQLNYSLHQKNATSYFTYTPKKVSPDDEIAFLIIPGSLANQTSDVIRGTGYHNLNCYVKNTLQKFGDVFILCKPLEDYRALQWNGKKFNSKDYVTPGLRYIYDYLDSINHPYGTNYLIEVLSMLKYMNQHYKKVVLLGCSMGGYSALLGALNSEVDGAMIASGYSIHFDDIPALQFSVTQLFKNLPLLYTDSLIKNKLSESRTEYLFSYADQEDYWYQLEHDTQLTENFVGPLPNCAYFYNFNFHSFPPCSVLDTFIQRVSDKPKLRFKTLDPTFHTAEILVAGKGPFSFDLYKNNNFYQSYSSVSTHLSITLPDSGVYYITHILNNDQTPGFCNDTLYFGERSHVNHTNPDPLFSYHIQYPLDKFMTIESIRNDGQDMEGRFYVMDLMGKVISQGEVRQGVIQADSSPWPTGIYLVQIKSGIQLYTLKVVKI